MITTITQFVQRARHFLLEMAWSCIPNGSSIPCISGRVRGIRMLKNEQASRSMLLGTYERDVQDAICQYVRPGDVFWDIGANLGFFTLLAARLTGGENVLAVEPIPDNISYIQASLGLNPGWTRNVRIIRAAVADRTGKATLALEKRGELTFTRAFLADSSDLSRRSLQVDMITLDELTRQFGTPTVIKMDIEGAEYRALLGGERLLTQHRPRLLIELHGDDIAGVCMDVLKQSHYDQIEFLPHDGIRPFVVASSSSLLK